MGATLSRVTVLGACLLLAACGSDNTTTFVLSTGSPSATASSSASGTAPSTGGASPSASSQPATGATPIAGGLRIIIDSPDGSTSISSPVEVSGAASVDNGTVIAVVLDTAGNELGRATTTASAARPNFGHYDVTVSFTGATPGTKGKIKVFGVSPKDGKTPTYFYYINVSFG